MKRVLCSFIVLLLCITLMHPLPALAETNAKAILANISLVESKAIEVPLILSDNSGIATLDIEIEFDESNLTLTEVRDNKLILGAELLTKNQLSSPFHISWINDLATQNSLANGRLATLAFSVNDNISVSSTPLYISNVEAYDKEMNLVPIKISAGNIKTVASISETEISMESGKTKTLVISNGDVATWTSNKKSIAIVKEGKVTALKKGSADIIATLADGTRLVCKVTVTSSPKIKIGKKKYKKNKTYSIKRRKNLNIYITGKATNVNNIYETSNKKVAKITSKKTAKKVKITAYKKKGTTMITLKVNGVPFKIKVKVK